MSNQIPTPTETLLIRAALERGERALAAWRSWSVAVDFDHLDRESHRLVPLLYRNLARQHVEPAATVRYRSVYRHSWATNRLAFRAAGRALGALHAQGIDTLLLKGTALTLLHYRHSGVRSMADVDVLVPTAQAWRAAAALRDDGWKGELQSALLTTGHSAPFVDAAGNEIDLHWHASADARWPDADEPFWVAAVATELDGVPTRALAPTDLLYNVLAHGYASDERHIRWAADAMTILAGDDIDWPRFVGHCRTRRLVLPVRTALSWLRAELGAPIPEHVLESLARSDVSTVDRLEHRHDTSEDPYTLSKVALRLWCRYRRSTDRRGLALVLGFPRYVDAHMRVVAPWRDRRPALRRLVDKLVEHGI